MCFKLGTDGRYSATKGISFLRFFVYFVEPTFFIFENVLDCGADLRNWRLYNWKSTTISFRLTTPKQENSRSNIQFTNQYQYNSMVDNNPREKVLYAWDKKRQVTCLLSYFWVTLDSWKTRIQKQELNVLLDKCFVFCRRHAQKSALVYNCTHVDLWFDQSYKFNKTQQLAFRFRLLFLSPPQRRLSTLVF